MFHYIEGEVLNTGGKVIIKNAFVGIEVLYEGNKQSGEFFLHPSFDQANNTYKYTAFETVEKKLAFEQVHKINGIGIKTAYQISRSPSDELAGAVKNFDVKYFQSIPGVGPKTAKRILIELKNTIGDDDISKLNIDDKLLKDIVGTLKPLGYDSKKVKSILGDCPISLDKKNLTEIIKWVINEIG